MLYFVLNFDNTRITWANKLRSTEKVDVTILDIAKRLGVSAQSVSFALNGNGRLGAETRQKILNVAKEMNYVPNIAARSLHSKKSFVFGIVIPYLSRSFFSHILAGVEEIAQENSFAILVGNSEGGPDVERRAVDIMLQHKVDGLIILPTPELQNFYNSSATSGISLVQIMHKLDILNAPSVTVDNYTGAKNAVEFLLSHQHKNIAMISHGEELQTFRARIKGFRDAVAKFGANSIEIAIPINADLAQIAVTELLDENPQITAIFCCNDYAALGATRAICKRGLTPGKDIEVIGFDDMHFANLQITYPISSVAQPKEEIGRIAARMLLDLIAKKEVASQILSTTLQLRNTTR